MKMKTRCLGASASRLRREWERHRTIARIQDELAASSDRALGELGIARGDIPRIAHAAL